jgi:branched-chain amino acid transport system permease protein
VSRIEALPGSALLRRVVPPVSRPLAVVALLLSVVGAWLPWATFAGLPGQLTLAYPGGPRLYCVVLATGLLVAFTRFSRRRDAGLACAVGIAAVAVQTIWATSKAGGGLVNVSPGAYVTVLGGLVGIALFLGLPDDTAPAPTMWRLPLLVDLAVVAAAVCVLVGFLVYVTLHVDAPSQFVAFVLASVAGFLALSRLGTFNLMSSAYGRRSGIALTMFALAAIIFPFTQGGSQYWLRVAANVGVFAAAGIGLNVVVGLAGLLDLGYIAFFGVGAYTAAMLGGGKLGPTIAHLPFVLVVALGAIAAGIVGVLIGAPTLRLRGDYLAIVTLGFGEIFRITANNLDGSSGPNITNGPNGFAQIPDLALGGFNFGDVHTVLGVDLPGFANYYYVELLLVAAVMFIFTRLNASRIGRAWVAIREDEVAAAAMGINTVSMKLLAFGIGATLAGTAGTVQAHVATQVSPDSFVFLQSVLLLAAVVLGGMGTVPGALIGAALLIAVPEKLRAFQDYRLLLFGLALVLLMRFRPEGIVASKRRAREFHEPAGGADALSAPPGAAA